MLICAGAIYDVNTVAGWPSSVFSVAVDSRDKWMVGLYEKVSVLLFQKYAVVVTAS